MIKHEHFGILKQGVGVWNQWRKDNVSEEIDLSGLVLSEMDLSGANLNRVNLSETNFRKANLSAVNLRNADLRASNLIEANLVRADLSQADLRDTLLLGANLSESDLSESNLGEADFTGANLSDTDLTDATLSNADLTKTNLSKADLRGSVFHGAILGDTIFDNNDLSKTVELEIARHRFASTLGIRTMQLSVGRIPEAFLRGCGLSDWEIESAKLFNPDLSNEEINKILYKMYDFRATQAIQISPLFISYSHGNSAFVDQLEVYLNRKGIRFWRDIHDAKAGRLEKQIDRAMRLNPTVVLILSEYSIKSDWVEHEVCTARQLEKEMKRDVLCPVALDNSWKNSTWPKRVMEQILEYNILDFSGWQDHAKFEDMFKKLIDGLGLFYQSK